MRSPAFRAAAADLLGGRPARHRLRPQRHPARLRLLAPPGQGLGAGRRDRRDPARPRRQRAAVGAGGRARRARPCAGSTLDPATAELDPASVAAAITDRHASGRGDRGIQSARHQAAGARRSRIAAHAVGALVYVDGVHCDRARARSTSASSAPTSSCARPTSSSARTARCSRRRRSCSRRSRPTSWRRRRTTCPSGSSSAPCPTRSMAGVTAAIDFLAGDRAGVGDRPSWAARAPRCTRSTSTSCGCASRSRQGLAEFGDAGRRALPRGRPHADPLDDDAGPAHLRRLPLPRRARRARAGERLLRLRGVPRARHRRRSARCGSASRRTPTTATSSACWMGWASS